jgi:hypothetical protein
VTWFRKNPLFATALSICALIALAEIGLIYERFMATRKAAKTLAQRKADLETMKAFTPPPSREIATAIEADLAKAQAALASMQSELKGKAAVVEKLRAAKVPAARTDAYFDIATYVERMRELAKKNEVDVRPEAARFGYAVYANEGPELERIEAIFRQRQVAQYLMEGLLEARPRNILAVKRTRPKTKAEREAHEAALANGQTPEPDVAEDGPDYFAIDSRASARVPGFVDTMPFRFVFTGQTAALRTFLNRLAAFDLPVLVREVEVETATGEEIAATAPTEEAAPTEQPAQPEASIVLSTETPPNAAKSATPPAARAPRGPTATPIVSKTFSKFTVTVEYVELVAPPANPADAPAPPTS